MREETAAYLAVLTNEMAKIAGDAGLPELAILYRRAKLQAEAIAKNAYAPSEACATE